MKNLLWIIPLLTGMAAMYYPKLLSVALLAILVCGGIWIVSLIVGTRGSSLPPSPGQDRSEQSRDPLGVQRDLPPPS